MLWKAPEPTDIDTLKWLGLVGLVAAVVDVLKALASEPANKDGGTWWRKLLRGVLTGLLSVGLGAMLVDLFPDISFFMLLGFASMAGYLGTDWVMALALRMWGDGKNGRS